MRKVIFVVWKSWNLEGGNFWWGMIFFFWMGKLGFVREWDGSGDKMIVKRVSGLVKCEIFIIGLIILFLVFVKG